MSTVSYIIYKNNTKKLDRHYKTAILSLILCVTARVDQADDGDHHWVHHSAGERGIPRTAHGTVYRRNGYEPSTIAILGYPGVISLTTSTPGTISWISFDVPLNEYYHFIGCIIIFWWARWPMKTILTRERLTDWTARYNASYRFSVADSKLF